MIVEVEVEVAKAALGPCEAPPIGLWTARDFVAVSEKGSMS